MFVVLVKPNDIRYIIRAIEDVLGAGEQSNKDSIDFALLAKGVLELCGDRSILGIQQLNKSILASNGEMLPLRVPAQQLNSLLTIGNTPGLDGWDWFGGCFWGGLVPADTLRLDHDGFSDGHDYVGGKKSENKKRCETRVWLCWQVVRMLAESGCIIKR